MRGFIGILLVAVLIGAFLQSLYTDYMTVDEHTVMSEDFEALQEAYDELYEEHEVLKDGYRDLQQEHSKAVERIEYLEYRIMSDDSISPELKQEIQENVPEEGEE